MSKRIFDVLFAFISILALSPFLIATALIVSFSSKGPVLYIQSRVGRNNNDFGLWKFRTMYVNGRSGGLLTIGDRDPRITKIGYWLRKYKIDELPQLFNVLKGDMSVVGPRPEVRKYVEMYDTTQQRVLSVKPGITDWASIQFRDESELLGRADDPEHFYITEIIPVKLQSNLEYIDHHDFFVDLRIIVFTIRKVLLGRHTSN